MEIQNQIIIYHQDETVLLKIQKITLKITDGFLDLEIETEQDKSTFLGMMRPKFYIESATLSVQNLTELTEERLEVPIGWDTEEEFKGDNIFRAYLDGHFALDNNIVTLRRLSSHEIEIIWNADAQDFKYYDEKANRNAIAIHAIYRTSSPAR